MNNCILNQNFFDEHMCSSFVLLKDKGMLLDYIKDFNLPYQSKINIGPNFQYGVEIEFDKANLYDIKKDVILISEKDNLVYMDDWYVKKELTIDNGNGCEIVSPISYNKPEDWMELSKICNILKKNYAEVTDECALHVHIDFNRLNFKLEDGIRLIKLWAAYEDEIYKFAIGERDSLRSLAGIYSAPMKNEIVLDNKIDGLNNYFSLAKNRDYKGWAIKFNDFIDKLNRDVCELSTIEFRISNGSINPRIIQNTIRFYCQFTNSILQNDKLVDYYIEKRFNSLKPLNEKKFRRNYPDEYENMSSDNFDKALELVDIICNNNMDKLCFLKQYLKEEEIEEAKLYQKKANVFRK